MADGRGFTLVEVLVSLVIGGILIAALGWTLAGLGADLQARPPHAELSQVRAITPPVTSMLTSALPPLSKAAGFSGDRNHLRMRVAPPLALGPVGPLTADLWVRSTRTGQGLFMSLAPERFGPSLPDAVRRDKLLADGFADIAFRYEKRSASDDMGLPKLISINFKTKDGQIAEIVASPRISSDGSCRFDVIAMACRQ